MKPYIANLINAGVLIAVGLLGYFGLETKAPTALIPVGFGALFLIMHPWMKKENKVVAHIVVVLTLLLILMLMGMPLRKAIANSNTGATVRLGAMILAGIFAMVSYIKSFRDVRKAREAEALKG